MNTKRSYQVGETVAIYNSGKPYQLLKVRSVRVYKNRTKIALSNGSEYDNRGDSWSGGAYARNHMRPYTDEVQADVQYAHDERTIVRAASTHYTPEQASRIANLIRVIAEEKQAAQNEAANRIAEEASK